jgi:4-amino-4-deoxy-L-arabinose transferase-like glycosyltransferase
MTDGSAGNALEPQEAEGGARSDVDSSPNDASSPALPDKAAEPAQSAAPERDPAATRPKAPLHPVRGSLLTLIGVAAPFLIMAADRHFSFSVPVGFVSLLIATCGVLDLLGTFDERARERTTQLELGALLPRLVELIAAVVVQIVALRLAVAGVLPKPIFTAAVLVTGSCLWIVIAGYRLAQCFGAFQHDETGASRPLHERHGFWLIVLNFALYLPLLGSFSLSDPWETHYGEVAREMLARDDWISLWWAQDGWFWSKPILDFWMQGLAFALLGVRFMPDQMLAGVAQGRFPQPEWAARMPIFVITVLGAYFMYKGVAKAFGRRAGFLGGLILTTLPYWYLISHQTMTDMPYVASLTAAMGLLMLGFQSDPDETVRTCRLRIGRFSVELSAFHLMFGVILLCVLPQVLYLVTRNVTLQLAASPHGFRPHLDEFFSGSGGGNCGLPGNEACSPQLPRNKNFQPWLSALVWSGLTGVLLWINRDERRTQRLYYIAGWFFVALSAMAKGAPGLVLPLFAVGLFIGATRRWKQIPALELASLVLIVAVVILPWYVQMFMRHGEPFTDRLVFHDMYKRAFVHVHDTNTGDDTSFRYYVWQLGYGLFPWTGLAAAGLLWWLRKNDEVHDARSGYAAFLALWFIGGFSLFTISLTKFHHYIFPAVPPLAMLAGVLVDRALGNASLPRGRALALYLGALGLGTTLLVYGASRFFPGALTGVLVAGKPHPARIGVAISAVALGVLLCILAVRRFASSSSAPEAPEQHYESLMVTMLGIASAVTIAVVGRDMFTTARGDIEGQARLVHLFTYNYRRPWPESLNFNAALIGFTLVAAALFVLLALRHWRTHVILAVCALGVLWGAWGVNVYHFKTAPHWGQRETLMAYYARRAGPQEPFVSYQMNWKGENFYTGNRTPAFVSSGQQFKDWVTQQKQKGVRVMFFTTEHGRVSSLKGEIGEHRKFELITEPVLNNKFVVARVEL